MKKTLIAFALLLSLTAAQEISAQGYAGVIAPGAEGAQASAAAGGGYSGVTSWDSVVSGSLYDFVNEAGQRAFAESDGRGSTAFAQIIQGKRQYFASILSQKQAIEQQMENEYFAKKKQQIARAMEEISRQRTLQR